jgi:hypothetical protein
MQTKLALEKHLSFFENYSEQTPFAIDEDQSILIITVFRCRKIYKSFSSCDDIV